MKITTIGRGAIGGTLGRLWGSAGHDVTQLGHDGGDASSAEVVLLAVPSLSITDALAAVSGLDSNKVIIDATNRLNGEAPPAGFPSNAEYVKDQTGATVAKSFNLNYGDIYEKAAGASVRPSNVWVGDDEAAAAVEQLSSDIGMQAVRGGDLSATATQEAFGYFLNSISGQLGGLVFYRFATPEHF